MGIKNLKSIIRKHAPEAIQPVSANFLNGKTVVIDSSILLYRYRYNFDDDFFHIKGFLYKIKEIIKCDITPIFVFDGTPPQAKQNVLSGRSELRNKMKSNLETFTKELEVLNEEFGQKNVDLFIDSDDEDSTDNEIKQKIIKVTSEIKKIKKNLLIVNKNHSTEVMELLKSLGVPFFQAPGEAEESCAFLQKNGYADYILTEDTDSLTFGGESVIMGQELVNLSKVLEKLELSYCEFIDFCILCGCDYTCTIPKIGPVNALKIIKRFRNIETFIESGTYKIPDSFDYQTARNLFRQNENYHFDVDFKMDLNFREFEKHLIQFNLN